MMIFNDMRPSDVRSGRRRVRLPRFLPALALLIAALWCFLSTPAYAQPTAPDPPTGVTVTAVSSTELTASWTAPATVTVTDYDVHYTRNASVSLTDPGPDAPEYGWVPYSHSEDTAGGQTPTATVGTSIRIIGLIPGTTYRVRVRAKNTNSARSAWVQASGTTNPGSPTIVKVTPVNAGVTPEWLPPLGTTTGYDLDYTTASESALGDNAPGTPGGLPASEWKAIDVGSNFRSSDLSGVSNGDIVRIRLRAKNGSATGPWVRATGIAGTIPITSLEVHPDDGRLVLEWSASGTPTGYDVHYSATSTWSDAGHTGTTTSHTITSLAPGTKYRVKVRAVNAHGNGPWASGESIAAFSLDNDFPHPTGELATPVRNLQVYEGRGQLAVHWDVPDFSLVPLPPGGKRRIVITESGRPGYRVNYTASMSVADDAEQGTDPATDWVGVAISSSDAHRLKCFITGLTNGTAYRVRVRANKVVTEFGDNDGSRFRRHGDQTSQWAVSSPVTPSVPTVDFVSATPNPVPEGEDVTITFRRSRAFSPDQYITPSGRYRGLSVNLTGTDGDYFHHGAPMVSFRAQSLTATEIVSTTHDGDATDDTFTISFATDFMAVPTDPTLAAQIRDAMAPGSVTSITITIRDDDGAGGSGTQANAGGDGTTPADSPPDSQQQSQEQQQVAGASGQQSQPDPPVVQPQEQRQQEPDDPADDDERDRPMLSVSLDVDDAEADQSLTALDVLPNRVFSIQIFGTYFQAIDEVFLRFDYDSTKVVYEGFSLGSVASAATVPGKDFVMIGMTLVKENPVVDGKSLMGTIRFRTTEAFSDTDIRQVQMKVRVEGEENIRILPRDQSIALGKATSLPEDFDGNGIVDISDFLLFVEAFGSRAGQARYDEEYDLNGDGEIGIDDFLIFIRSFGK